MPMTEKQVVRTLNSLYGLCMAGERGFGSIAQNVSNRGLKVLLKSYARQRGDFAGQLRAEIEKRGGNVSERRSIQGMIHRGRINIRAALTIGPQNVENAVLGEARPGEKRVVKAYKNCLSKDLPADIKQLIQGQLQEIEGVGDEVRLLRGTAGKRLAVRLFDAQADVDLAIQALIDAGYPRDGITTEDVGQLSRYEGVGSTVSEAVLSGAFGGALWGGLIGLGFGISALFIPNLDTMMGVSSYGVWIAIALLGLLFGAIMGAVLGMFIGQGTTEADQFLYDASVRYGTILLRLNTTVDRADEAGRIMHQVNAAARVRGGVWPAAAVPSSGGD